MEKEILVKMKVIYEDEKEVKCYLSSDKAKTLAIKPEDVVGEIDPDQTPAYQGYAPKSQ